VIAHRASEPDHTSSDIRTIPAFRTSRLNPWGRGMGFVPVFKVREPSCGLALGTLLRRGDGSTSQRISTTTV
jgi:hypothetical protein